MQKNTKFGLGLGAVLTLFSATALAGWSNAVMIASIDLDGVSGGNGTSTYVTPAQDPGGKPCSATQVQLFGTADHVKAMTALATSAFLAGKAVKFSFNGSCTGNYSQVSSLLVQ